MRHATLDVITEEHQALAAMLRSMSLLVAQSSRDKRLPDFEVLRAMLFYVDEFPERLHHTKESQLLFPAVLRHCPELAGVIARLEDEHAAGERAIRHLQHTLLAFEMMGEPRREAFEEACATYLRFYLEHMAVEEGQIIPAARRCFTEEDWVPLDAAFAANKDPLAGHEPAPDYKPLFSRILMHAEAPIGYGSPR